MILIFLILILFTNSLKLNSINIINNNKKKLNDFNKIIYEDEEFGEILWDHQLELLDNNELIVKTKKKNNNKNKNKCKVNKFINKNIIIAKYKIKNLSIDDSLSKKIKNNLENDIKNNIISDYEILNLEEFNDLELIFDNEKLLITVVKSVSSTFDENKELFLSKEDDKKSYKILKFFLLSIFIFFKSPKNVV